MFRRLGDNLKCFLKNVKCTLLANRAHFYIALAAAVLGFLTALSGNYSNIIQAKCFIIVIIGGSTSPLPQFFSILLYTTLIYAAVLAASFHFIVFIIAGYGAIFAAAYFALRSALIAMAVSSELGFIYLLLYIIPMCVLYFTCVTCALGRICDIGGFRRGPKRCAPLCLNNALIEIKPFFLYNLAVALIYWVLFYIVLVLII